MEMGINNISSSYREKLNEATPRQVARLETKYDDD